WRWTKAASGTGRAIVLPAPDASSAAVGAAQRRGREDVPVDRLVEREAPVARPEVELRVERVQREDVAVRLARRRARPPVARSAEVVPPLGRRRLALSELARGGGEVPREPVGERVPPRVRVVDAEGERRRALGRRR